ncbi:DoxX family protein [Bowmanella yangjiangensis]|uniref:DoxX family protein n=1 Tax=Bowmanella yangjiangensis TaxID=2811230 RepID=A0ABS3CQE7_9ALTE|nr:DoxX family protein [Bowmanella yangjiangensis]MBN7818515.1 DoxX family protein [Bowmanella yangjiangensis]
MNILLWTLQILIAIHTAIGALWKFSNPAQSMQSLAAIPNAAWLGLGVIELLCCLGLIVPLLYKPGAILAPLAALVIAASMLLFSLLHWQSGEANAGPLYYWLTVAVLCVFISYGRLVLAPLK